MDSAGNARGGGMMAPGTNLSSAPPFSAGSITRDQIQRGPGAAAPGAYPRSGKKPTTNPVYRSLSQILGIKENLTMQYAARDVMYRFLQRIYDGDAWRYVMEDLRYNRVNQKRYEKDEKYRIVVNYVFASTNDYVDMLSKEPSVHVPPLHASDIMSQDHAAMVEKTYYGIWQASEMRRQWYDFAWYNALLGSSVLESWPDAEDGIPKILVQHPGSFYFREKFGRPGEILYSIQRFFLTPDQIADAYGDEWKDNGQYSQLDARSGQWITAEDWIPNMTRIEGFIFHSQWEKTLVIQNQIIDGYSVQYDEPCKIPYRVCHFIKRPGKNYGIGAAEQTWALNQYLNQLFSQEANILAYTANPIMVVKEPTQVPQDIPNDPGAVISVGPQGSVSWLQWQHGPAELTQQMDRTKRYLQDVSGLPETRYGNTKQSFVTGRAVEQLNAPTQDRIASRLRLMGSELAAINEIAMWQFENLSKNREVTFYGQTGEGNSFAMAIKGKDIKGYRHNVISWDNHDHSDAVEVLQLTGANLIDKRTALIQLGVREPDQILERVRQDRLEDIEFARLLQAAQQSVIDASAQAQLLGTPGATQQIAGPSGAAQIAESLQSGATGMAGPGQPPLGAPGGPSGGGGPSGPGPAAPPAGPAGPAGPPPGSPQAGAAQQILAQHANPAAPGHVRRGFGPSPNLHLAGPGGNGGGNFDRGQVVNDFRALPPEKLKGQVFLIGDITNGAANKIGVFLTNGVDKKTIIDLLPQYKGYLVFTVGTKVPAHAMDVTPKQFVAPPKGQPGIGNQPPQRPAGGLEPKGGLVRNPAGLTLEKAGGMPIGYSQLPQVPPGTGLPQVVNP